jgi:hypothetical protein
MASIVWRLREPAHAAGSWTPPEVWAYGLRTPWRCLRRAHGGDWVNMGIGTSLFLIAVGAILNFAVDAQISGIEIKTIGLILMVVGVIGLLISLFLLASARRDTGTVVRERRDVY